MVVAEVQIRSSAVAFLLFFGNWRFFGDVAVSFAVQLVGLNMKRRELPCRHLPHIALRLRRGKAAYLSLEVLLNIEPGCAVGEGVPAIFSNYVD